MRRILALLLFIPLLALPVRADYGSKYVSLTFDDGPSGKYTRALLDGLYDRGAKATFLLCGYRLRDYPDIAQRIFDEGHEIGLHGYSHKNLQNLSRRDIAAELMDTQALLPEGCHPAFFRPPGGLYSDAVIQVAQARGLAILHWSVDPHDWEIHNEQAIEKAVLEKVRDGDIILLHDMTTTKLCRRYAARMIERGVRGHILNMSSYSLWMPFPGLAIYSASKAYLKAFSVAFSKEVADQGVRVTAICPAGVATDLYGLSPKLQKLGLRLGALITPDRCARRGLSALWRGVRCSVPDWWNRLWIPLLVSLPMWILRPLRNYTMKFQK